MTEKTEHTKPSLHTPLLIGEGPGVRLLVLFDMDGVLYDSMPNHAIAWVQSMAFFGIPFSKEDAYLSEGEKGVDTVRRYSFKQTGKEISLERAIEMYKYKAHLFQTLGEAEVMPGVMEFMEKLHNQNFVIGVVTGSGQKPLIARIQRDFAGFVAPDHIVCAFDVTHGKPDPEPYLIGMKKCWSPSPALPQVGGEKRNAFLPEETIVIENAPLGVRSGHAAGAYVIAVNTGPLPDEVLLREGADILFPSMQALCEGWEGLGLPRIT